MVARSNIEAKFESVAWETYKLLLLKITLKDLKVE